MDIEMSIQQKVLFFERGSQFCAAENSSSTQELSNFLESQLFRKCVCVFAAFSSKKHRRKVSDFVIVARVVGRLYIGEPQSLKARPAQKQRPAFS